MKSSFISHSQKETKDFAKNLARRMLLKTTQRKNALVLGLEGELGAGKTTFIQGFAQGLRIKEKVLSPTFLIMRKYQILPLRGISRRETNFYHIDCYRLHKPAELLALGFKEIVSNPDNIVVIEWADRVRTILPKNSIKILFSHEGKNKRAIALSGFIWKQPVLD